MAKIALATYTIRMRHRYKGDALILNNTHVRTSFAEEFRVFANSLKIEHDRNPLARSVLSTQELYDQPDMVWGTVNAGAYGQARDVVNSDTNAAAYRVAPNEAILHPFYFMLYAPLEGTRAVYVLQRHGNTGIHSAFTGAFRRFFSQRNPDLILEVQRHVPREVLDYLEYGDLKRVQYTSFSVPKELDEVVRLGGNTEGKVVVRSAITAREKGGVLPMPDWVKGAVQRRVGPDGGLLEGPILKDVEQENVSLTFRYNGNERTLNLSRPSSLAPYVDVSAEVRMNDDGHPEVVDLHREAIRLRDDIVREIGRA